METKTILATVYAVNPFKGSEDGMGWNFVCQIARFNNVIAITRENNRPHIEKYMEENPNDIYENMQFLYFDLPYWLRWWKKGGRGAMLYYWMWQRGVVSFVKKQHVQFDLVHNLNFHNDWTPSFLWRLKKPLVWGPIGHHPLIPNQYLRRYGKKYWLKDRLTWIVKKAFWNCSISLKKTVRKADHIFCMNESVAEVVKLDDKEHTIMPSVATEDFGYEPMKSNENFSLISAGRLIPLKGFDLSILGFSSFIKKLPAKERENCKLTIVGSGPELNNYKKISRENEMDSNIEFVKWLDRRELLELTKSSSAFLFPSHEGAGMVVSEALSFGLPVICLDNSGPGEFIDSSCGYAVKIQNYKNTIKDLGEAIYKLYSNNNLKREMSKNARIRFEDKFHWDRRGEILNQTYLKLL